MEQILGLCDSNHGDLTGIRGFDALISSLGRQLSVVVDIDFTVLNVYNTRDFVLGRTLLFSEFITTLRDSFTKDLMHFFRQ